VENFKVAFVIYAIADLLAPSAKHDHVNIEFWGAFKNPDLIERFNLSRPLKRQEMSRFARTVALLSLADTYFCRCNYDRSLIIYICRIFIKLLLTCFYQYWYS
jgi:hypothetical protein